MSYMKDLMTAFNLIEKNADANLSQYHHNLLETVLSDLDTCMDSDGIREAFFDDDLCGDCQYLVRTIDTQTLVECGQSNAEMCPAVEALNL